MEADADTLITWLTMLSSEPLFIGVALALATLVSEDAALLTGALLVGSDMLTPGLAIGSLTAGIVLGDIGLYGAGAWLRESRFVRRRLSPKRMRRLKRWLDGRESLVLFASRFLPGTRLPTYLGFGYLRLSLFRFSAILLVAGGVWVTAMVLFVSETQKFLSQFGGGAGLVGGALAAIIVIALGPPLVRKLTSAPDLTDNDDEKDPARGC